jgi:hypothetical protein
MFLSPNKHNSLLQQISERLSNYCKMVHKFPVITSQPKETSKLLNRRRLRPRYNCFHFGRISSNALRTYYMPQISNLLLSKLALRYLNTPLILGQKLQHHSNVLDMFFKRSTIDEYIIKEY